MKDAVARFAELVSRPSEEVDLSRAALAYAEAVDPAVDADRWLRELDRLAAGVADFGGLRRRLFTDGGFTGVVESRYYEPDNSLLHRVLERRRGIPITLSVVTMEVGRRAGVAVQGIGAPGHFLVRDPASGWFCDPFARGTLLDEEQVLARLSPAAGEGPRPGALSLPIVDAHQILARMLANLAQAYRANSRLDELQLVLRCQGAIPGGRPGAAAQLGEVLASHGRFHEAARELLDVAEDAAPADQQTLHAAAKALLARLN